ncbi:adenylate/guanylate cyclase domain-containing protein [Sphingobacterium composti Ten et al. 2007 non Yoo et al. 2007]|uniref:adenylate/guanylate cyclase domain-containing protein n=1 Tax=Sphingobacterium composti TaxID=363260 RepID=UPI00135753D2|nr:adenylate/guanylate cyclase domain-containing protein [Sphingobacterium composti Ten et al. 2007 non Yoo et al. 2007]
MAIIDTITEEVNNVLNIAWDERTGSVIPETTDVALKNGAVKIEATFLYADLAGSSILAKICPWQTTAKIIRSYLDTAVRLIRYHGGEVRSFDGDRVMGVFKGTTPNTSAANCARNIDWVVTNLINPKAKEKFKSIRDNDIKIKHCVGIDTSEARAVRSGIRNNNDLIWIGKAPSFAAKLSDIRDYPYEVYISKESFNKLASDAKKNGTEDVWTSKIVTIGGENYTVYRTNTPLKP